MSGMMSIMLNSSGGFTPNGGARNSTGPGAQSISFATDGTSSGTDATLYTWGTPTTAGIGSMYWINFTSTGGTGTTTGTVGSWLQLSINRFIGCANAPVSQQRTKTFTYQIASDSAGVTVVASGTISVMSDNV